MPIETDGDGTNDNEGPHCRNCHVGASNCDVCHSSVAGNTAAYTPNWTATAALTNYAPQSWARLSAVTGGTECLDGGFTWPHRTLGDNMLKDELFGVNFDGTLASFGTTRSANGLQVGADIDGADRNWELWVAETRNVTSIIPAVSGDSGALLNTPVENLDSVCIDCHGDATYWNGDAEVAAYYNSTADSLLPLGTYGSGQRGGWELLLKGLP